MKKLMKWALPVMLLGAVFVTENCGYRLRSSVGTLPEGILSLGVPTFQNLTNEYKIEQRITGAVLNEFTQRTRVPVLSKNRGVDAVLLGDIRSVRSTPVTFGNLSFGTSFSVTVVISAKLIRLKDSTVVWQNNEFTFRERYTMNRDIQDFFSEENPALDRLAQSFAASLVSTILESQSFDNTKH